MEPQEIGLQLRDWVVVIATCLEMVYLLQLLVDLETRERERECERSVLKSVVS